MNFKQKQSYIWIGLIVIAFGLGFWLRGGSDKSDQTHDHTTEERAENTLYTCSMHPQIQLSDPDALCPICGMELIPLTEDSGSSNPRQVTLSERARKLARVQTVAVERKFVETEIRMVGKIEYDETTVRHITAWFPGRLDRMFVDYEGMPVRQGDHLVEIYSPELLAAQQELIQAARTASTASGSNLGTMRETAEQTLVAVREKLRLWGLSDAQIEAIETRAKPSDHLTLYAPISGVVVDKPAREGDYVQTGSRIYTIADLSKVWVLLDAYESDLQWLHYGQDVEFETEAYPGETFQGRIAFIDPILNNKTRTIKVRVNVENPDGRLKPDMFVRAIVRAQVAEGGKVMDPELANKWISPMHPEIVKDHPGTCDVCGMALVKAEELGFINLEDRRKEASLVIPATAPLITGKRAVVYVAVPGDEGLYEGRTVVLGPRAGDYYLVEDGLDAGERVVVNGNFKIDSAIQIQGKPSMMNPEEEKPQVELISEHLDDLETFSNVNAAFQEDLQSVYAAYLKIQEALSQDNVEAAQSTVSSFLSALENVDMSVLSGSAHTAWMEALPTLEKSAQALQKASSLDAARTAFDPLSQAMIATAKQFGSSESLFVYHCPMAFDFQGADWLQNTAGTKNPFFGSEMFKCGDQVAVLGEATGEMETLEHEHESLSEPQDQSQSETEPTPADGKSGAKFLNQLDQVYEAYFELQQALSQDNFAESQKAGKALGIVVTEVDRHGMNSEQHDIWMKEYDRIMGALQDVQYGQNIAQIRTGFEPLSAAMIRLAEAFGSRKHKLLLFHCPMAFDFDGADWLQNKEGVENPYFGSEMFKCGTQKADLSAGK